MALVNLMSDVALRKAEQQFAELLEGSSERWVTRWRKFTFPGIARGQSACEYLSANYLDLAGVWTDPPDAVVVTGAEPVSPDIRDESYWSDLARLLDWIVRTDTPALLSCLTAHAAVRHLDGIERRRLADKRFGMFDHVRVSDHKVTAGMPQRMRVAHSRWHHVDEDALEANGYRVLTRSAEAGVDMFTKHAILFCQGHPEYDAAALLREYRRDIGRFLNGGRTTYPNAPAGYFDADSEAIVAAFRLRAEKERDARLLATFPYDTLLAGLSGPGPVSAAGVAREWLADAVQRTDLAAVIEHA